MKQKTYQLLILLLVTFTFMDYEELSDDTGIQVYDYTEDVVCEVYEVFNIDGFTFTVCHDLPDNPPNMVSDVQL